MSGAKYGSSGLSHIQREVAAPKAVILFFDFVVTPTDPGTL